MPCLICDEENSKDLANPHSYICQNCIRKELHKQNETLSKEFMENMINKFKKTKEISNLNPF